MKKQSIMNIKQWIKAIFIAFMLGGLVNVAYAQSSADTLDLGSVAHNVTNTFSNIAQLITASSYVAGLGFAIGAILKFKAHKDNPQQITVGVPIALMFVAAALIFLPSMFKVAEGTLFGSSGGTAAGVTGCTTLDCSGGS